MEWAEVEEVVEVLDMVVEWVEAVDLDVVPVLVDMVDGGLVSSPANTAPVGEQLTVVLGLPGGLVLMVAETVDGTGGPPGTPCTMTTI